MFTGLIERVGRVESLRSHGPGSVIAIKLNPEFPDLRQGESVAVDGVCLTVSALLAGGFSADISPETLRLTTLGRKRPGERVNLERAVRPTDRLGGHLVSGHVDGIARVVGLQREGSFARLSVALPLPSLRLVAVKGSLALDGVSLTVAELRGEEVGVAVIPETLAATTLGERRAGENVNFEVDLVARYVERLLSPAAGGDGDQGLLSRLREGGFMR